MQVDLTPVIQTSVSLAALGLGTLGSWALYRLADKLGVQRNSAAMANLTTAATNVSVMALGKLQDTIARKGWDHPEVKNLTLAMGATALAAKYPGTLADAGLDPKKDSLKVQARITDVLERVFPAAVAQAAASPATPPSDLTMATAPEQDPQPLQAIAGADGFGKPFVDPTMATLTDAVTNLIASHETTNSLLGKLVDRGTVPVDLPKAEGAAAGAAEALAGVQAGAAAPVVQTPAAPALAPVTA